MRNINRMLILVSKMDSIKDAIERVGGPIQAAKVCGVTRQAVDKWIHSGRLPRTDYTGETNYAELLAKASKGAFTARQLKALASPQRPAA